MTSRCEIHFEEGVESSAEWLVRKTEPKLLRLALQFTFLQLCMELRQQYNSTDDIPEDFVMRTIDECRPSSLMCLLVERLLGEREGGEFKRRLAEALRRNGGDREFNLSEISIIALFTPDSNSYCKPCNSPFPCR